MATVTAEKLSDLQEARRHAVGLNHYRQKHREVPSIDPEEMLELYTAIEHLEDSGVETKTAPAETQTKTESCPRCGEQAYLLNLCGKCIQILVRNADTFKTEATAETKETAAEPTETKTKGDAAADKIIAAFEGEEYLADSDLLKASGLKRSEYIEVRDYLLYTTNELVEIEPEEDGVTVYAYAKPRKQVAAA